ncbi:MAG: pimeloyl-ACP methyl ester carboxylesterase [Myxococcota bacterium]|jgi:pimeloyl-ACP methyl ester carboxylesterase
MPPTHHTPVGAITLAWESFGDPADPTLLLVPGTAAQMLFWGEPLCAGLAARGLHVVRMDPRDTGLSTHLDRLETWPAWRSLIRYAVGRPVREAYTIEDMARDVAGLVTANRWGPAFVAGWSMGSVVVQALAVARPALVRKLVLFGAPTYRRGVGQPGARDLLHILRPPDPPDPAAAGAIARRVLQRQAGPHYRLSPPELEALIAGLRERPTPEPGARWRQLATGLAFGDVTRTSVHVRQPVLLVHGTADTISNSELLLRTLSDARLERIPGMGHLIPDALAPDLTRVVGDFLLE